MSPKKTNGYVLFVFEWMNKNGQRNFQMAIRQAARDWDSLSEEEKGHYKEQAKIRNSGGKGTPLGIVPSPSPYAEKGSNERVSLKERVIDPEMRARLVETLCDKPVDEMLKTDIYIMSFNVSIKTRNNIYVPIEIGIVKYNLAEGIKGSHHEYIDGGRIPVGHGAEIKAHQERVHRLSLYDISEYPVYEAVATHTDMEHDESVNKSIAAIEKFVQAERIVVPNQNIDEEPISFKPIFTLPDMDGLGLEQTDGCLKRMALEVKNTKFYENYVVLDLSYLMFHLIKKGSPDNNRPLASCVELLNREIYSFITGTSCEFHEELDTPHCAVARSYRCAYRMMDAVIPIYDTIKVTSKHEPRTKPDPDFGEYHKNLRYVPPNVQRWVDKNTQKAKAKGSYWT